MLSTHAPFRLLRTTVVAATILGLAAGAHVVAGGTLPAPAIMAALMSLHILCSTVATKFKLGLPAMTGLLATSQVVLHQAFEMLSGAMPAGALTVGVHDHSLSAEQQTSAALHSAALMTSSGTSGMDLMNHSGALSGAMLPAHIAATLATALLLSQGESALWALANWLRPLYRRATTVLLLPARQARPAVSPRPLPRLPWRNLRPDTRRGPPNAWAVFA